MEQKKNDRKRCGGKHFTLEDRVRLETLIDVFYPKGTPPNFTRLAGQLGKHRTSISREYERGRVKNRDCELREYFVYSARRGQDAADQAALNKGPRGKLTNRLAEAIRAEIVDNKRSPYAGIEILRKTGQHSWLPCERTVYYAIDAGLINVSREQLPYKPRKKKRKKSGTRMAYTNARGRSITERPQAANDRSEYGHWEMDTVVGGTGTSPACLLVLTERVTRGQVIRKIPSRTQEDVIRALDRLEREPNSIFEKMKTLTCDNGCEFLNFKAIERSAIHAGTRCMVFFAHPFTSSERGSNENANRIIRRFIPKGADISKYTRAQIQKIQDWMNSLPRKILDGLSAEEKVKQYFQEAA